MVLKLQASTWALVWGSTGALGPSEAGITAVLLAKESNIWDREECCAYGLFLNIIITANRQILWVENVKQWMRTRGKMMWSCNST